jgi:hypothetical protein
LPHEGFALLDNPTIAFLATYKVIRNLLGGFSAGDSSPIPASRFVINEDMRPAALNSRLSFESHSIAAGRVPNLSTHPYFAVALAAFSNWLEGDVALHRLRRSRLSAGPDISVAGVNAALRPLGAWLIECSR